MLLRRGGRHSDRELEVLMVRRAETQSFMPGVWVFPGGVIEPGERPEECARRASSRRRPGLRPATPSHVWARWITPRSSRCASTPTSSWASPRRIRPRTRTAARSTTPVLNPRGALEAHRAGKLELVFPTIRTLETLLPFADAAEVIEAARDRVVEPILPRVAGTRRPPRVPRRATTGTRTPRRTRIV